MTTNGIDEELLMDIVKIFVAMLAGGIIGFERELKDKPAGLRTNILVSTGSCLFVIFAFRVSELYSDDPGRIIGPIITGIGFLGAGTIIRARGSVRGLTSAATIWVVAGVGMSAGMGLFLLALTISLLVLFILLILPKVEEAISVYGVTDLEYIVITKPTKSSVLKTRHILKELSLTYFRFHVAKDDETYKIKFYAHGRHTELSRLIPRLLELPEVIETRMENPQYSY
ncbi:MAG: MgtC/SapB family protein [Candidatus Aminicenantes bacterium]|nr:MAG: MgtC/SapB family protein [Candidatus Aminicenantes bacterium]